ncbi:hypothetical protein A4G29_21610 [Mycobacterium kansasii]|nr:hypothetical protein A4G29_21610 [Mycobacterium kansasii]
MVTSTGGPVPAAAAGLPRAAQRKGVDGVEGVGGCDMFHVIVASIDAATYSAEVDMGQRSPAVAT